jgi:hypothetical protein
MTDDIITVDPREVTFLIHRDRDPVRFELVKDSIRELGVIQPLHVRDITDWPAKDRRRPDGGLYKWQAMFGEGRCTALIELHSATQDARFLRCPAIVKVIPPGEIVGRFLAENILRRDLPWADQARLIRAEVEQRLRESEPDGRKPKAKPRTFIREIAQHYFITEGHAAKLLRILSQASVELSRSLQKFTLEEAETIVALAESRAGHRDGDVARGRAGTVAGHGAGAESTGDRGGGAVDQDRAETSGAPGERRPVPATGTVEAVSAALVERCGQSRSALVGQGVSKGGR